MIVMRASIVIRTLDEAEHLPDLLKLIARQRVTGLDVETVLIDSGSSDGTVQIAQDHGARITTITKAEFSFGRSLNRGCAFSTGEILVFISGHCVPVDDEWLQRLCQPLMDGKAAYSYGRQIGDDDSNFSERRIFAKYFPDQSAIPQEGFFCNNANSALLRSAWEKHPFDEELTGLEDMDLAKRLVAQGMQIGYVADAAVFHHHKESWPQIRRRFEREALALRSIMPEVHLSRLDVMRYVITSTFGDWRAARLNGVTSTSRMDMLRYRWNQYLGSFKGNNEHRRLSRKAKERFFYPHVSDKAEQDEWLRPVRRTSPNES
ncbi:MAG: glycosyltransferase [Rhodobacteraceae bacterium]|nr:glycosyltransferase [Paracoccaceae bacterium]